MDESWNAAVEIECTANGEFFAVLVLTPPAEIGSPIRTRLEGEYDSPMAAESAALDVVAAMTRGA